MQPKTVRYIINSLYATSGVFLTLIFLNGSGVVLVNTELMIISALFSFLFFYLLTPQALTDDFLFKERTSRPYGK